MIVESLRLLRTNYSVKFYFAIPPTSKRAFRQEAINTITSEIKFTERKSALQQNEKVRNKIIPIFTTYHPAREILKEPPTHLYQKGKSFHTRNLRVVSGLSTLYIRRRNGISVFTSSTNKIWLSISIREEPIKNYLPYSQKYVTSTDDIITLGIQTSLSPAPPVG